MALAGRRHLRSLWRDAVTKERDDRSTLQHDVLEGLRVRSTERDVPSRDREDGTLRAGDVSKDRDDGITCPKGLAEQRQLPSECPAVLSQ